LFQNTAEFQSRQISLCSKSSFSHFSPKIFSLKAHKIIPEKYNTSQGFFPDNIISVKPAPV
ncbi:MAG: hypothetical protein WBO86_18720, partial [Blautia wexlerae]